MRSLGLEMSDRRDDSDPRRASGEQGLPGSEGRTSDVNGASAADGQLDSAAARSVLGSLPRTRPQRASARRASSQPKRTSAKASSAAPKRSAAKKPTAKGKGPAGKTADGKPQGASGRRGARTQTESVASARRASPTPRRRPERKQPPPLPQRPRAPKQGYEPEEDLDLGRTVNPPSPVELAESVADIFIELASASFKSGGRVLKDVLSPLRRH
jgi:hypothetical protein